MPSHRWADLPTYRGDHELLLLVLAGLSLLVALRYLRRALAPIGPLMRAAGAAAVAAFSVCCAFVLITAVVLGS
jgi:hypothetical protein